MKLTKEIVQIISSIKNEPEWMLEFRLNALDALLIIIRKGKKSLLIIGIIYLVVLEIYLMI